MKTVIKAVSDNHVCIKYECHISGDIITDEFSAPIAGGYVRFANGSQVCDKLRCRGNTLYWSGEAPLINLIRREYSAMRRQQSKEAR